MKKFVFIPVLIICSVFILIGIFQVKKGYESLSWPSVKGIVTSSEIEESHSSSHKKSSSAKWSVELKYQYTIEGNEYSGTRITYKGIDSSHQGAIELSKKYSIGKHVMVYYNPENKAEAVLVQGYGWMGIIFIVMPVVMLLFWIIILFVRKNKVIIN